MNLEQAAVAAQKYIQALHPKRYVTLVGKGFREGEAWHVEMQVGVISDIHQYVLLVHPNGTITQISHDATP